MNDILRKLTSRKLWVSIAGLICGMVIAFGGDANEIQSIAGSVTAMVSIISYIAGESKIDAERVKKDDAERVKKEDDENG